jgi:mycofactocin biosynthesis protein MftB
VSTEPADAARSFDLEAPWRLHPQVAIRPERFGALLYHYGTRRLSFLKTPTLLEIVRSLDMHDSARAACEAAGVGVEQLPSYSAALATLATSSMICAGNSP